MNTYISNFLAYSRNNPYKTLSKNTLDNYQLDLLQFIGFIKKDCLDIVQNDILLYRKYLKDFRIPQKNKPYSIKTINRKLVSVNQFLKYLNEETEFNKTIIIKPEKIQFQNIRSEILNSNDVKRILNSACKVKDYRTIALIYTLFYTGTRISEALQIKTSDVDSDKIWIIGKGEKYRQIFIPKILKQSWHEYLKVRYESESEFLFVGQKGPMTRQYAGRCIKYYAGMAKIKKDKVYPHAFRHLFSKNLYEAAVPYVVIKQLMGHQLSVTENYMQYSEKDILKFIDKIEL